MFVEHNCGDILLVADVKVNYQWNARYAGRNNETDSIAIMHGNLQAA